jgi:hypothetical protein
MERLKNETIKEAIRHESESIPPNAVGVSWNIYLSVDKSIQDLLYLPGNRSNENGIRIYQVRVDKS